MCWSGVASAGQGGQRWSGGRGGGRGWSEVVRGVWVWGGGSVKGVGEGVGPGREGLGVTLKCLGP